jgi:DNA primase large subunit
LFEIQHAHVGVVRGAGIGGGDSVDHPNKYFDESRKLYREKKEEEVKNKEGKMEVD